MGATTRAVVVLSVVGLPLARLAGTRGDVAASHVEVAAVDSR
ncbi:hypothetical protein [Kineococcus aurantiacus]|uniref:Uncharacterized protein n=1 Tax=Kineococcus aurantiacus TaxID=37633 RepID=A0A7Y9DQL8_9ACTN|nr:hypothetical protein [Kineococcus aurantiacus]NYD24917.1 hypothetical protein [Kineococcus aurantiacus]